MNELFKYDNENISAVILSAGRSGRFGKPKAFLAFDENKSFLQKILLEYLEAGIKKIVLVINSDLKEKTEDMIHDLPSELKIKIVVNLHPETGRFDSLKLAVDALENSHHIFIQNIDNPFTSSELLIDMINKSGDGDYVVPYYFGEKGHPVLVSEKIIQHIRQMHSSGGNLRDVLKNYLPVEIATGDPYILANINTREDYSRYFNAIPSVI